MTARACFCVRAALRAWVMLLSARAMSVRGCSLAFFPIILIVIVISIIMMQGRHIMVGYKDDADNSARALDAHGWLHSGDIGTIDTDGFLRITGRIKELIKTAGGENIPPVSQQQSLTMTSSWS